MILCIDSISGKRTFESLALRRSKQCPMFRSEDKVAMRHIVEALVVYAGSMADAYGNPLRLNLGDRDQALRHVAEAMTRARDAIAYDARGTVAEARQYVVYLRKAAILRDSDPAGAVEACRQAISEGRPIQSVSKYWNGHAEIAYPLRKLGRHQEALRELRKALELEQAASRSRSFTHNEMGDLLLEMGDRTGALDYYRQALALAVAAVEKTPRMMERRRDLADCYERLGQFYEVEKDLSTSREWYQKALEVWRDWPRFGVSSPFNVRREQEAARMGARCEAALAKK
jgi:tetratricopeptide (TPR) repeat protein